MTGPLPPRFVAGCTPDQTITLWLPGRPRGDRRGVLLALPPGEPRSGYARLGVELADALTRLGVAVAVVGLPFGDEHVDVARLWGDHVEEGGRALLAADFHPWLLVTRGIADTAHSTLQRLALSPAPPGWASWGDLTPARVVALGFEELWSGSPCLARLQKGLATADRAEGAPRIVTVASAPSSCTDPLFRRVWEKAWLIGLLAAVVHE